MGGGRHRWHTYVDFIYEKKKPSVEKGWAFQEIEMRSLAIHIKNISKIKIDPSCCTEK